MAKWKITIEKSFEETIEANSEKEAIDIAWEMWSQDNEVDEFYSQPIMETFDDNCDYEVGYDPYMGCFSDDC